MTERRWRQWAGSVATTIAFVVKTIATTQFWRWSKRIEWLWPTLHEFRVIVSCPRALLITSLVLWHITWLTHTHKIALKHFELWNASNSFLILKAFNFSIDIIIKLPHILEEIGKLQKWPRKNIWQHFWPLNEEKIIPEKRSKDSSRIFVPTNLGLASWATSQG